MIQRLSLQSTGKFVLATLAASALVLGGCSSDRQIGGIGGSGGGSDPTMTTGSGGDSSTTGSGGENPGTTTTSTGTSGGEGLNSVAIFNSQVTQTAAGDKTHWLAPGETLAPTTLLVIVSSEAQSCEMTVFDYGTKTHRQVLIGLPEAMQAVGKYDLSSTEVIAFGDTWLGDGMGNGGGGESALNQGTVEVVSIDSLTIKVRLAGLPDDFSDLQTHDYLAPRCP